MQTRIRAAVAAVVAAALVSLSGCGASITKVKYIQHTASTQLRLPDNTVVSAPAGKHFMLYLINCIDNSTRDEGFFFTVERLRDSDGQDTVIEGGAGYDYLRRGGAGSLNVDLNDASIENVNVWNSTENHRFDADGKVENVFVRSGQGNDFIRGGEGNDHLDGRAGNDRIADDRR